MDGRSFLTPARELARGKTEAHWRAAAGRAYYAPFLESLAALARWGLPRPPQHQVHAYVRLRFTYASDPGVQNIGRKLDTLVTLRNEADYRIASPGSFRNNQAATIAVDLADQHIILLDQVDQDIPRRTAAIADIRSRRWP